jgi:hypothetical protein
MRMADALCLRAQQCQVIYVGDPYQQIYEWRGAVNAMEHIRAPECALTESFRFGLPSPSSPAACCN